MLCDILDETIFICRKNDEIKQSFGRHFLFKCAAGGRRYEFRGLRSPSKVADFTLRVRVRAGERILQPVAQRLVVALRFCLRGLAATARVVLVGA